MQTTNGNTLNEELKVFSENAPEIFRDVTEKTGLNIDELLQKENEEIYQLFNKDPIVKSLIDMVMNDYSNSPTECTVYYSADPSVMHIDIHGIRRKDALSIINDYVDSVGITQQSLRRVVPTSFSTVVNEGASKHRFDVLLGYLRYHWAIYKNVPKEEARKFLSVDTKTNIFFSGHKSDILALKLELSTNDSYWYRNDIELNDWKYVNAHKFVNADRGYTIIIESSLPAIIASCSVYNIDPSTKDSSYIESIVNMGHMSILEHIMVTVEGDMPIDALNQLIRHRHKKLEFNHSETDYIGDVVHFKLVTNMREALSIIGERTCSRAQTDIREMAECMMDALLSIEEYRYMQKHIGSKCVLGLKCNEPCSNPAKGKKLQLGQINYEYIENAID